MLKINPKAKKKLQGLYANIHAKRDRVRRPHVVGNPILGGG